MSISASSVVRVLMVAVLLCTAPNGWSKTPKSRGNRKLVWAGLVVAGAGVAIFATSGYAVATPRQCALVPLATICVPAQNYTEHRQSQQVAGAVTVFTGGVMVWRGLPGK